MIAEAFVDTNLLVYLFSSSPEEVSKRQVIADLVERTAFGISAQVVQEFYVTMTRKIKKPLSSAEACRLVDWLSQFPCVPTDLALIRQAFEIQERFGISYWDAAVIAAAKRLGCRVLYTEDLNPGQKYANMIVVNPFK